MCIYIYLTFQKITRNRNRLDLFIFRSLILGGIYMIYILGVWGMGLRHVPPYKIADLIPETTQGSIKLDEIRAPSHLPNPHEFPPSTAHEKGQGDGGRSRKIVCWPWRCSLPREPPPTSAPWIPWASDLGFSKACSVRRLFFWPLFGQRGLLES